MSLAKTTAVAGSVALVRSGDMVSFQRARTALIGAFRDISAAAWRLAFLRAFAPALRHSGEQYRENPRPGGTRETPQIPQRAFRVPFACLSARQSATERRFASARHSRWTFRGRPRPRPFGLYCNGCEQIWHSFGEKSGRSVISGTFVRFVRFGNAATWTFVINRSVSVNIKRATPRVMNDRQKSGRVLLAQNFRAVFSCGRSATRDCFVPCGAPGA